MNAVGVLAYADSGISQLQKDAGAKSTAICNAGGQPQGGTRGPGGYALLGQKPAEAKAGFFSTVRPRIFAKVAPKLSRGPCADLASYVAAMPVNLANIARIKAPVFVLQAQRDALFPPPAGRAQSKRYVGSRKVTFRTLGATAHALAFERGRIELQRDLST